jgi:hypothetical protein
MFDKIKEYFETDYYYTKLAYEIGSADKNAYYYGIQRCYGVAQFFNEVEGITDLFEYYREKYERLGKNFSKNP